MKRTIAAVMAIGCSMIPSVVAHAQTCAGAASFSSGVARIGAAVTFNDGATLYGGGLAVGAAHGPFLTVNAGQISYSNLSGKSSVIGASLGYGISVGSNAEFCPVLGYTHTSFPDITSGSTTITSSLDNIGFGGTIGMKAVASSTVTFVPYTGLQYIHATANSSSAGFGSSSSSQDYGILTFGVGMVVNESVTFGPSVGIPLGLTGGKTSVSIGLSLNFGHTDHK